MDAIAKRVIIAGAFVLCLSGVVPVAVLSVHGQDKDNPRIDQLEWETKHLREQLAEFKSLPTDVALILAHQRLEDERYKDSQEVQSKLLWGFISTTGGFIMSFAVWALNQSGISIGSKEPRRRTA